MKMRCGFAFVSLFLAPFVARAVTDTWDGGGVNNLITLDDNWVDNTAPLSDLANTDLIFAGSTRLTPALNASFSTRSITFNNTAGAFVTSGQPLVVGTGGIVNNDAQTMTLGNTFVRFASVANSTINAAVGGLTFTNTVTLPTSTLTVTGAGPTSFGNVSGSGALNKTGTGTMTWAPDITTALDLTIDAGTVTMGADGSVDLFNSSAAIAVNGASTFHINESLTLDGAQLARALTATLDLAPGKTLTVQNGGDVVMSGPFTNNTASTIAVTGAGSTFSSGNLGIQAGSNLAIAAGGSVTTGLSDVRIGVTGGNGTVTVDGAGSTLSGDSLFIGQAGFTGSLTFSNESMGQFSSVGLDLSSVAGTNGSLAIQSGATVNGTSLLLASLVSANTGTLTVTGANSALTLNGAGPATIGASSASSGTLNVNSSATLNSGTGLTTVNPTGTINLNSGTLNLRGPLTVSGTLAITGTGTIEGSGSITKDGVTTLTLPNSNNYAGGTVLRGGTIVAGAASGALGTGNVIVESGAVKLSIQTGVVSAIADNATLSLAGGGVLNVADNGFAELAAGVNEILSGLILGTELKPPGTYGSTSSGATFQSNEFFSGPGILTVVPEPGAAITLIAGFTALIGLQRFGRSNPR